MNAKHSAPRRPVILVILDGFGTNPSKRNNGIALADTPHLDAYFSRYPHALIQASGHAVGLPDGQMGNSEVGHLTLGSGSIVRQDLVRIDDAIADGSFFENPTLVGAMRSAKELGRPMQLLGLVSDGGVHSQLGHLLALIELSRRWGVRPLLHMITDGRDTPPRSALGYLEAVESALQAADGAIASVSGRYYSMDRDNRWERTERAWRAILLGKGRRASSARAAIESAYALGENDEFIKPCILPAWQPPEADDPIISFNFRKDRPRQIVAALGQAEFAVFDRGGTPLLDVTCMMQYDPQFRMPFAFIPEAPAATLAEAVSAAGLRQLHCAETEKYAHVTYFFNGGRREPWPGEDRVMVPSPKVATYDLAPEMSAGRVADEVIEAIGRDEYAFILVNFANGDMVGHTAVRSAVIAAVESLDREVGRLLEAAVAADYSVILTADHGNCEELVDPTTDAPHTQHTSYPVPCMIIDSSTWQLSCGGGLANIAPTALHLMGLPRPEGMTHRSLLLKEIEIAVDLQRFEGAA